MYVAISRITNINNIFLIGEYSSSAFKVNKDVEYERLRKDSTFEPCKTIIVDDHSLTISLLNTRSLKKHAVDILADVRLMENDILCLTETQLDITANTVGIENTILASTQILTNFLVLQCVYEIK